MPVMLALLALKCHMQAKSQIGSTWLHDSFKLYWKWVISAKKYFSTKTQYFLGITAVYTVQGSSCAQIGGSSFVV